MTQPADRPALSAAEWRLIEALRALPDEALRTRVHGSLQELLYFFETPRCQGPGVDGFPCGDPKSSCDECHQIWEALDRVALRCRQPGC